jgi:hypothetical protein
MENSDRAEVGITKGASHFTKSIAASSQKWNLFCSRIAMRSLFAKLLKSSQRPAELALTDNPARLSGKHGGGLPVDFA